MSSQPATVLTGCLAPIDKDGLEGLIEKGKADPKAVKTLKCKTVAEGKFRHAFDPGEFKGFGNRVLVERLLQSGDQACARGDGFIAAWFACRVRALAALGADVDPVRRDCTQVPVLSVILVSIVAFMRIRPLTIWADQPA